MLASFASSVPLKYAATCARLGDVSSRVFVAPPPCAAPATTTTTAPGVSRFASLYAPAFGASVG